MSKTLKSWIESALTPSNLVALVMAGFAFYLSYDHFRSNMEYRVAALEKSVKHQKKFNGNVANQVNHLCSRMESCAQRNSPVKSPD